MFGLFAKPMQKFYCLTQRHCWWPRVLFRWGNYPDDHMETTNRPSCPDHVEIFLNDWGDRDDHMETRLNIYLPSNNPSLRWLLQSLTYSCILRSTQRQFSENICWEDDLRSRIFGTFVVKFLACLPLLGFSNT